MNETKNNSIELNGENFPDKHFRCYISESFDTDGDGYITREEAEAVTSIDISGDREEKVNVSSLKGIEFFTELKELNCTNNKLKSLDISKNNGLRILECGNNELTELDISRNSLFQLNCENNKLTSLDLSKNTELYYLECSGNKLAELDVSKYEKLEAIKCDKNVKITEPDGLGRRIMLK